MDTHTYPVPEATKERTLTLADPAVVDDLIENRQNKTD